MITLTTEMARALLTWSSADAFQPTVNGVAINQGHLVATDGARLLAVPVAMVGAWNGPDVLIPRGPLADAAKMAGPKGTLEISLVPSTGTLRVGIQRATPKTRGAKVPDPAVVEIRLDASVQFPSWERLMPAPDAPLYAFRCNPAFLGDMEAVALAFEGADHQGVLLVSGGYPDPTLWTTASGARMVIMPMRGDDAEEAQARQLRDAALNRKRVTELETTITDVQTRYDRLLGEALNRSRTLPEIEADMADVRRSLESIRDSLAN